MKRAFSNVTTPGRYHYVTYFILIICFPGLLVLGCNKNDDQPLEPVKEVSQEIRELIYFRGDEKAPTVLINVQSGPSTEFATDFVDLIVSSFNTTGILTVNVHQAQTLNPGIMEGNDITLDQAVSFNTESVETLFKVISYFKAQGRTVYVLGVSFGAFMTQELIAKKGIDVADKYLIMAGRLDMNQDVWQALVEGRYGYFENGVEPIIDAEPHEKVIERNYARISAGLGMNRYTQVLNTIEDLSRVTYAYGATDQAVGSLTTREVEFLESKNAQIIAGNGGHDHVILGLSAQGMNQAFGIQ